LFFLFLLTKLGRAFASNCVPNFADSQEYLQKKRNIHTPSHTEFQPLKNFMQIVSMTLNKEIWKKTTSDISKDQVSNKEKAEHCVVQPSFQRGFVSNYNFLQLIAYHFQKKNSNLSKRCSYKMQLMKLVYFEKSLDFIGGIL